MTELDIRKNELIIHFDVDTHRIPFNQFFQTANNVKLIIDEINKKLFDNKVRYKLYVTPPAKGGLIEGLLIGLTFVGPIFGFIASSPGQSFIEGLTGENTDYWFKAAGIKFKKYWQDENGCLYYTTPNDQKKKITKAQEKIIASTLYSKIIASFLEKNYSQLVKVGLYKSIFRNAYKAKNGIYEDCIQNKEVKAIGFDTTHNFPIKREDFYGLVVELPEEEENEEDLDWNVEVKHLIVNSPNWKPDGRSWQASDNKKTTVTFVIEDNFFWHEVKQKNLKPDINDSIEVQWAYPAHLAKPSQIRVLKVLSFNGKQLSEPYTLEELHKILNKPHLKNENRDLFS